MKTEELSNLQRGDPLTKVAAEGHSDPEVEPSFQARSDSRFDAGIYLERDCTYSKADWLSLIALFDAHPSVQPSISATQQDVPVPLANECAEISMLRTNAGDASIELKLTAGEFSGTTISFTRCNDTGVISIEINVPPSQLDAIARRMPTIRAALERRGVAGCTVRIRGQAS